jgi:hypothetical protein
VIRKTKLISDKTQFFVCSRYSYDELRVVGKHQRKLSKKCQKEQFKSGGKTQTNPIIFANGGTLST